MVLKLYGAPLSSATLRVAIVLHEKNVPFRLHLVDLLKREQKAAEYLEKQPFGQVPYIDDDGFILYESRAIARYIAGTPLVPDIANVQAWALHEQAASCEVANFDPFAAKISFEKFFKPRIGQEPDAAVVDAAVSALSDKLDVYEKILSKQPYLTGTEVTLADISHIVGASRLYLAGAGHLIDSRPSVKAWYERLTERPSWTSVKNGLPIFREDE
ncbi:glutathione S-transferase [Coprinopsis sp. MPI-PUGE-AT-0042]|nr:glutathione S-transferase [Coprinopsis sp. MPI-PUGE-AT-0042]